ncbi:MAG TPA: carboxylating nicotinate-nucleotide diphosphorylase [Bacteroidales bacterium]|nr:carboxylating nicotinate-nucleotide diphosphorylase [Bacteroidales bacterium]
MSLNKELLDQFIDHALIEDVGDGDHSSLACIPEKAEGSSKLLIKQKGILAGVDVAEFIFRKLEPSIQIEILIGDGEKVTTGDISFIVTGKIQTLLKAERLVLNIMQRMSGIATHTRQYADMLKDYHTTVLDTRKTTPGMRMLDKEAVRLGGGENHRMGLYDMIMLKDNHIDFAGGIEKAISKTRAYLKEKNKSLKIEIEVRSLDNVKKVLATGGIDRIMFDNFTPEDTKKAVELIDGRFETESSGMINLDTVTKYAASGVDYVSVGALTHQIKSLDMSLKAII